MSPERRMGFGDASQGRSNGAGRANPSSLARRCRDAVAPAKTDRGRQLLDESVHLGPSLSGAFEVGEVVRLVGLLAKLDESSTVRGLCRLIQYGPVLADTDCTACIGARDGEIERVCLPAGCSDKTTQQLEPATVRQADRDLIES